jgi:hypothetical protein
MYKPILEDIMFNVYKDRKKSLLMIEIVLTICAIGLGIGGFKDLVYLKMMWLFIGGVFIIRGLELNLSKSDKGFYSNYILGTVFIVAAIVNLSMR